MGKFLNAVGSVFFGLSLLATICVFMTYPWLLVITVPAGYLMLRKPNEKSQ